MGQSIVTLHSEGYRVRDIAKIVSYAAVRSVIVRYNETGKTNNDWIWSGHPKMTSKSQDKFTILQNKYPTANEIVTQTSETGETSEFPRTTRRKPISVGLNDRCAARKPTIDLSGK